LLRLPVTLHLVSCRRNHQGLPGAVAA
jgi:hypothetical protein